MKSKLNSIVGLVGVWAIATTATAAPQNVILFIGDGMVGPKDLDLLLLNWDLDSDNLPADWSSQRPLPHVSVGLSNLNEVLFNWASGTPVASIPEPAGGTLLLAVACLWRFVASRRQ